MGRCMQMDPRRRFVFGFTVEDSDMRLWLLDRVQLVVSTPFNYLTVSISPLSKRLPRYSCEIPRITDLWLTLS